MISIAYVSRGLRSTCSQHRRPSDGPGISYASNVDWMLEFDECSQILVTNPFADDGSTVSSSDDHDGLVALTLGGSSASSGHHPLRSRSVSPALRCDAPNIPFVTVIGSDGEMPSLDGLELSAKGVAPEEEEDQTAASDSDTILHPVRPFHPVTLW